MYTILNGQVKACRVLLQQGASVHIRDESGSTPLHMAATKGSLDLTKLLLKSGADVAAVDSLRRTALHWATRCVSPAVLECLLAHSFKILVNARDDEQLTALHWAVISNHPDHVRLLVTNQADPAIGDGEGRTPLHYAVSKNAIECIQILLHLRPEVVNLTDGCGRTSLHVACGEGSIEAVNIILASPRVNVACADNRGTTPLHWASVCNRAEICRVLLQFGAPVMARDNAGMTALHYAHKKGFADCVGVMQRLVMATTPPSPGHLQKRSSIA